MLPVISSGRTRGRVSALRSLLISTSALTAVALLATGPGRAQTAPPVQVAQNQVAQNQGTLPPVQIQAPRKKPQARARKPGGRPSTVAAPPSPGEGLSTGQALAGIPMTPLNGVAASATRLGLPVIETPASVDIVTQQTMQEQGYRTTTDTALGAVGVLSGDAGGAPAGFSMRGFSFSEVNVTYNGIWIGPQDITSRWMDTANLAQVEFLKGPSSLMTGINAIGGAVNYVSRQPTSGPIQNELDMSFDSYGSPRTHYGSGGNTGMQGLDYRFDAVADKLNSFIDGDFRDLTELSGQLNYHVTKDFMVFGATDYQKDSGHAYWGTPLVSTSFPGVSPVSGVVSGTAVSTFSGNNLGPVTIDSRTLSTNYNVADNATGAQSLWLRSGFEWTPLNTVTVKDQGYYYEAKRNWIDSETYAFDDGAEIAANTIDRDRFAVSHQQHVIGNNLDLSWDAQFFGLQNRFAAQLQTSRNWTTFKQMDDGGFPQDSVSVVAPDPGLYGPVDFDIRNSRLDTIAGSFEDRLKLTSAFALIGGVRLDDLTLARNGINSDGTIPDGQPFTKTWNPVSYRAAYTYEPIHDLMFYSMYATAYDPAVAAVFSVSPANSLQLTSSQTYETGAKQLFWDGKAEWTVALYDIIQRNVLVPVNVTTTDVAGEVASKGVELAAAVNPIEGLKLWGNAAFTHARFVNFDVWTSNTPPNVAPLIVNAGASYRFNHWRWPVEFGGSVRHVGPRFLFQDDLTTLDAYTTADVYAFVDIPGRDIAMSDFKTVRVTARVRNLTNVVYAQWADPGLQDTVLLGAPRTYEIAASAKW
jgi:iron complex outermembrane receptor protein